MDNAESLARLADFPLALFRDWCVRYSLRRSMQALSCDERSRFLRESGFSATEFETCLNTVFGSEDLLSRLIRAIGLDPERIRAASPETMRDLERTCMTCPIKRRCRAQLARNEAAAGYQAYCPNAQILTGLVAEPVGG